jgi:hypothetical protein
MFWEAAFDVQRGCGHISSSPTLVTASQILQMMLAMLKHFPDLYLDEIQEQL